MEEDFIELAKEDEETIKIIKERLLETKEMNIATMAAQTPKLIINVECLKTAMNIAGDTIYDLTIDNNVLQEENNDLKEELGKYTKIDYEKLKNNERDRRRKLHNQEKGKIILEKLRITVNKTKQLTG